ncbi:hypothetical protein TBLA_0G02370 [Henningerozyma blattae CBS 6284]|uniref:CCT-beta n=1 Tax=Henningerozyma blattae (strain ATCC 34711 / CBS 6284 / DSM 70876 / NBRC 10599 / NRRL Y-10934 / UCD 77-7) TaxID=1071380 RepID=I2H725_HENB6|nr:hypothetical protein TBLA_0G02370 [Tetrapisispora blattae CBS 6284]CCH62177.1 hypothetical protein TBLA_0G02370 [Tetrapisispora blattae CBS 6284]
MSVQIFGDQVVEERGENARMSAFVGAIAVADLVKSTLGPKGMDKLLQSASSDQSIVTNDGATILKSIPLDNPAAKVLVNLSKVQDDEIGDGTTSVTVLSGELLREAEKLIEQSKIHPQTVIEGYRIASRAALKALEEVAVDNSKDPVKFRDDLVKIAKTTLSSKILSQDKEQFAELATEAILRLKGNTNLEHIQIIKILGGNLEDSFLDDGFLLAKKFGTNQPKRVENAKILIANTGLDSDKVKIFGTKFKSNSTSGIAQLERAERERMKGKVEKISKFGINTFVNRQLIYDYPEQLFSDKGINSVEHADFEGVERLALATGGDVVSTFDDPEHCRLGECDLIEEIVIGEETFLRFSGCKVREACSIVLRGATLQVLDEAERSLHDALGVLSQTTREPRTVLGGGCAEMVMSRAVDTAAQSTDGKRAMAVEAFARALRQLPTILADNAGLDSGELVTRLRAAAYGGLSSAGLDLTRGELGDMRELGIVESFTLKRAVVRAAAEASEVLLRVDHVVRARPRTAGRAQ